MAWIRLARLWKTWLVLVAGTTAQAATGSAGDELPSYILEPGMVLSYERRVTFK
jgi:hypothetical protein